MRPSIVVFVPLVLLLASPLDASVVSDDARLPAQYAPVWLQHNPSSHTKIAHTLWGSFLGTYVMPPRYGLTRVNYAAVTPIDKSKLGQYISQMSRIRITRYNRKEQLAFWINVYNASVVQLILNHYPIDNVLSIDPSPFVENFGPWEATIITVEGINLSLKEIRYNIIAKIANNGLALYGLCNGAIGAPSLGGKPYEGEFIEQQLRTAAAAYINSPRGAQVINGKLYLSQFYQWYAGEFGKNEKAIIDQIRRYATSSLKKALKDVEHVQGYQYNWHLNQVLPTHHHTL